MTEENLTAQSIDSLIASLVSMELLDFDPKSGFEMAPREALADGFHAIEISRLADLAANACIAAVTLYAAMGRHEKHETDLVSRAIQLSRYTDARKAARAKIANDPKQAAKDGAKKLWSDWKSGQHPTLRTTEQFAIEVMRRWPILKSAKNICSWSAQWNKETTTRRKLTQ